MGQDLKDLLKEWKKYYNNEFSNDRGLPADDENLVKKSKKEQIYQQVRVSPNGELIAYVTNDARLPVFVDSCGGFEQRTDAGCGERESHFTVRFR